MPLLTRGTRKTQEGAAAVLLERILRTYHMPSTPVRSRTHPYNPFMLSFINLALQMKTRLTGAGTLD